MVNPVSGGTNPAAQPILGRKAYGSANSVGEERRSTGAADEVLFGKGTALNDNDKANLVVERALARLRAVVDDARAELGLPEGAELDTSAEATAGRIAGFALNFFDQYAKKNGLENNEEGRKQFADFIGGAISQGISEARGILSALNALDPDTGSKVDSIAEIVQKRLDDFVKNGPAAAA